MESIEQKRYFLVASSNETRRNTLIQKIQEHVSNAVVHTAQDGAEARHKMDNATPHVLMTEDNLPKLSGLKLIEDVLADKRFPDVAIVCMSHIPDQDLFTDDVLKGRVQFLMDPDNDAQLASCLARVLNYLSARAHLEFNIRFLSAGETLLHEGDEAETVFLVKRGRLQAIHRMKDRVVNLGVIEAGEFAGEMAYLNHEKRSADVIAESDCELIEIPVTRLDHLLFEKPAWARALLKTLSKRVKVANRNMGKS